MHTTDSREDKRMIRAVVFDIDNTMYSFDRAHKTASEELVKYCKAAFSLSGEDAETMLLKAKRLAEDRLGKDCAAMHNRLIRFQCFLELLQNREYVRAMEMYHIYWDTLIRVMEPEPGIQEFLSGLKEKKIRIGIGSDMTAYIQYRKLQRLGVLDYIDSILMSEEAGVEKPDPYFFRLCAEKLGCAPKECAFIGDHVRKDVEGAANCGMRGIWYCPGAPEEETRPCIRSFTDCIRGNELFLPCGSGGCWESIGQ